MNWRKKNTQDFKKSGFGEKKFQGRSWEGGKPEAEKRSSPQFQGRSWEGGKPEAEKRSSPQFQGRSWEGGKPNSELGTPNSFQNFTPQDNKIKVDSEIISKYGGALTKDFRPQLKSSNKWNTGNTDNNMKTKYKKNTTKHLENNMKETRPNIPVDITDTTIWDLPVEGYLCFEGYARNNWGYKPKAFDKIFPPSEKSPSLYQTIYSKYENTSKLMEENRILTFMVSSADIPVTSIDLAYQVFELENLDTYHFTQKYKINHYFNMDKPKILKELRKNKEHLLKIQQLKNSKKTLNKEQQNKIKRECVYKFKIEQIHHYINTYLQD